MAEQEEEISGLELEVKKAQDHISKLQTANMRLENENESLMAMEERVSSLTEENARLQALHAKAGDFDALEKEKDRHQVKVVELLAENHALEVDISRYANLVDEHKTALERAQRQTAEANEVINLKQKMIETLRDQAEQQSITAEPSPRGEGNNEIMDEFGAEFGGGGVQEEPSMAQKMEEMQQMMQQQMQQSMEQMKVQMQQQQQEQQMALQQMQIQHLAAKPASPPQPTQARAEAKVLTSEHSSRERTLSTASIESEFGGEQPEVDLERREEDFLVTVDRLMESAQTIGTCLLNLTQAMAQWGGRFPKVVMEFKVASNANGIMNICLAELFGASNRLPEYTQCLKAKLADVGKRPYAKPSGLIWKRLETRYRKHQRLLTDAREAAISLNNMLLQPRLAAAAN